MDAIFLDRSWRDLGKDFLPQKRQDDRFQFQFFFGNPFRAAFALGDDGIFKQKLISLIRQ